MQWTRRWRVRRLVLMICSLAPLMEFPPICSEGHRLYDEDYVNIWQLFCEGRTERIGSNLQKCGWPFANHFLNTVSMIITIYVTRAYPLKRLGAHIVGKCCLRILSSNFGGQHFSCILVLHLGFLRQNGTSALQKTLCSCFNQQQMAWQKNGGVTSHKEAHGDTFVGYCAHSHNQIFERTLDL